jgi:hypothetical protein
LGQPLEGAINYYTHQQAMILGHPLADLIQAENAVAK